MDDFIAKVITTIINPLILFLFALAILFFLWGVLQFIMSQDSEEGKTTGKTHMIWGIIGLTIMMAVWGIMNLLINTFDIKGIEINQNQNEANIKVDLTP